MSPHSEPLEQILSELKTNEARGLTAAQVQEYIQKFGENRLKEKKKKSNLRRFLEQFKDVMILILIAAAVVSFVIACYEGEPKEFFEPVLILLIVVMNAVMGMMQESKAEKALDALKSLSAPHARVIRDGKEQVIDAVHLVPGDIIKLEAGDFIPADARLIHSVSLKAEESALTGESVPSEKSADTAVAGNAPLGDRSNMVFSGCSVTYGTAVAVVTATGMNTEMGRIANLLEGEEETQTPLQKKLANLGKYLGIMALAACGIIFVIGLMNGIPVMEIFMTAVSLAVSAIPEGLPAIVTIVLSIGVQRMVKKNAIIRRLPAVETLGSASIICSDKTGTLTQNRMTLVKGYVDGEKEMEEIGSSNTEQIRRLLMYATLCSDGSVVVEDGKEKHIGDPTETSIVLAALRNGMEKEELNRSCPRLAELPFDSDRKLMTSVNRIDGELIVIVKGAFDVMSSRCVGGNIDRARELTEEMSREALRVLAVGYKKIDALPSEPTSEDLENGLTLMGLVGMIDPPRPEVRDAVAVCRRAGIKPVMITGDHVVTASAIAKDLGIFEEGDEAVTGAELDAMSDGELNERVRRISVYARVSPENKIRIVKAWQTQGEVVSMTGDGVNDAPALKAADIGCAMGITGTDVAKGAADMTLTDDNFTTIVDAVREGRGIYANIKKVVGFLLGTNIGEVVTVFAAMLLWHKSPLLSMQLLWINLVTDSLPAVALGMEAVESDVMDYPPKSRNEGIFANGFGIRTALQGLMFGALSLFAFRYAWNTTGSVEGGRTLAFMVLSLSQIVQAFNMRSNHSLFKTGFFGNRKLNMAALLSFVLVLLVLFTPLSVAFGLIRLDASLYLAGLGLCLVPLVVMELSKAFGLIKHEGGK
ncbi:calcium-translocating P-type ATPase, PMCA-type [Anaerolentibacter hominis]|uniref:calcium-translocating P-type ATPase, PMCA-type n=1 Tax=Anaerolentibacter hominis TaxID=3079009 RepID=UPI0031B87480